MIKRYFDFQLENLIYRTAAKGMFLISLAYVDKLKEKYIFNFIFNFVRRT